MAMVLKAIGGEGENMDVVLIGKIVLLNAYFTMYEKHRFIPKAYL